MSPFFLKLYIEVRVERHSAQLQCKMFAYKTHEEPIKRNEYCSSTEYFLHPTDTHTNSQKMTTDLQNSNKGPAAASWKTGVVLLVVGLCSAVLSVNIFSQYEHLNHLDLASKSSSR